MFSSMIIPDASSEAYSSQQPLNPILAASHPEPAGNLQIGSSTPKKSSALEELTSWEYFLNELEYE